MDTHTGLQRKPLFGGKLPWTKDDWTASDDRVRGGKSQSYLTIAQDQALFEGNLDTKTLGGAGFASQRTTRDDRHWDLASFDGIEVVCDAEKSDEKIYALVLKDEILPKSPNGREQSTISWEYNFKITDMQADQIDAQSRTLKIPWNDFSATYRGRSKPDAEPLDRTDIRRVSIMMRSYFDSQSGDFQLAIRSISAYTQSKVADDGSETSSLNSLEKPRPVTETAAKNSSWRSWLCCTL